ncbi:hypothetical protein ACFW2V_14020 [Streptomyces sp. NPDC058947]|uniref:hypothetical protein n=1 Tax=Streptomyces sp. NPDC058947 TaxID=3346675 RepID=UPI0036CE458F
MSDTDDDSALEAALLRQHRPERADTLEEERVQVEQLLLPGLMQGGLSAAEARIEAMNVLARFERRSSERIITDVVEGPKEACRSTQHCAYHGWCHRCDPRFAALMSEINRIIQSTSGDHHTWGSLYEQIGKVLHGSSEVVLAAELAETRETQQRLERRLQEVKHRIEGLEK